MQPSLVTLTTDFGSGSAYVAAMKGVLLGVAPNAGVIDLSHDIPAQDVRAAALFLRDALPFFPPGMIHVAVVDPGVGSDRAALLVEANGSFILAPDNGIWTLAAHKPGKVWRLNQPRFWQQTVSPMFHGRDVFAPVAGHLAMGTPLADMAEQVNNWCTLELPLPTAQGTSVIGEVIHVDRFGNLITNLIPVTHSSKLWIAGREVDIVRTYADRPGKTLIALCSSNGLLEIAVVNGSAAATLGVGIGTRVELRPGLVS